MVATREQVCLFTCVPGAPRLTSPVETRRTPGIIAFGYGPQALRAPSSSSAWSHAASAVAYFPSTTAHTFTFEQTLLGFGAGALQPWGGSRSAKPLGGCGGVVGEEARPAREVGVLLCLRCVARSPPSRGGEWACSAKISSPTQLQLLSHRQRTCAGLPITAIITTSNDLPIPVVAGSVLFPTAVHLPLSVGGSINTF